VPFCAHHCGYCDFAVTAGQDHLIDLYLEALGAELATLGIPRPVECLFVGGGTPTHLSADQLRRLLEVIRRWLPLEGPQLLTSPLEGEVRAGAAEFSVEANPDSLAEEKAAVLAAGGVTRVSIGVQSFAPQSLSALDRRHAPEHVGPAVEAVRRHIPVVSFDLIFGAPGSTPDAWRADLDAGARVRPAARVHLRADLREGHAALEEGRPAGW
jgi:oxygen-independent coproporphyrinogen-3 oxidase